jgi:hypothetical protein
MITQAGKTSFTDGVLSIIIDQFSFCNDKHYMLEPQSAKAFFSCCGEQYVIENTQSVSNVEDWYWSELLPKVQMLNLLLPE